LPFPRPGEGPHVRRCDGVKLGADRLPARRRIVVPLVTAVVDEGSRSDLGVHRRSSSRRRRTASTTKRPRPPRAARASNSARVRRPARDVGAGGEGSHGADPTAGQTGRTTSRASPAHPPCAGEGAYADAVLKLFIFALPVILTIYGLIDCVLTPEPDMRWLPKVAWVMMILLLPGVGAAIWLIWGREDSGGTRTRGISRPGGRAGPARTRRMSAPDDDPEFLRQLRNSDRDHERVLRQWERELRRREGGSAGGRSAEETTSGSPPDASPPTPDPSTNPSTGAQNPPSPAGPGATTPVPDASQEAGADDTGGPAAPSDPEWPHDDDH
jgi:hypothetical protein